MSTPASSNLPRFDVSPNTGKPLNVHHRTETAVKRITKTAHIVQPIVSKHRQQEGAQCAPGVASMVKPALSRSSARL